MRVVLLAAGYGTRLEADLQKTDDPAYHPLRGVPKPLLPVAGRALLSHWVALLRELQPPPSGVTVVVNALHYSRYEAWLQSLPPSHLKVELLNEGSSSNASRSGAVQCMRLATAGSGPEHYIVVAGDTLLPPSFSLSDFIADQHDRQAAAASPVSLVISAPVAEENVRKHGILEVGEDGRVLRFLEKPEPETTTSRLQCPCVYLLHAAALPLLQEFLTSRSQEPLSGRDAPGLFLAYLVQHQTVYHHPVQCRYDIGGLDAYIQCCASLDQQDSS